MRCHRRRYIFVFILFIFDSRTGFRSRAAAAVSVRRPRLRSPRIATLLAIGWPPLVAGDECTPSVQLTPRRLVSVEPLSRLAAMVAGNCPLLGLGNLGRLLVLGNPDTDGRRLLITLGADRDGVCGVNGATRGSAATSTCSSSTGWLPLMAGSAVGADVTAPCPIGGNPPLGLGGTGGGILAAAG